jgi:arylsulfatase A-like enzyme
VKDARRLVLALALAASGCRPGLAEDPRPDVLFVVVDTLRADHLPFHGYEKETTPFLARVAEESVVFERAWSGSSWTAPATASLFTGVLPVQHGVLTGYHAYGEKGEVVAAIDVDRIPRGLPTMPELMRGLGYRTFGIADNANIRAESGFASGFDRFVDHDYRGAPVVNTQLAEWKDAIREGGAPWFVYLHYMDPHGPYHKRAPYYDFDESVLEIDHALAPPAVHEVTDDPWIRRYEVRQLLHRAQTAGSPEETQRWIGLIRSYLEAVYDSEVRFLDAHLEEAFELLGVDDSTLVVFVSDHGEELGDRGRVGHEFQLHRELLHAPLLLRLPVAASGERTAGRVSADVSTVDLLPTLLDVLGAPRPEHLRGANLLDRLGTGTGGGPPVFSSRTREIEGRPTEQLDGVIHERMKLIVSRPAGRAELYDLDEDPLETTDLAAEHPDEVARLRALFDGLDELRAWPRESVPVELDDEQRARIEELGYGGE